MNPSILRFPKVAIMMAFLSFFSVAMFSCGNKKEASNDPKDVLKDFDVNGDISDDVLRYLIEVDETLQPIIGSSNQERMTLLEGYGISIQEFNEMYMKFQNPLEESDAPEEESAMFKTLMKAFETIEQKAIKEYEDKIVESGFTLDQYKGLVERINKEPELMQRIQDIFKSKTEDLSPDDFMDMMPQDGEDIDLED
jgi:hypothetical protein